MINAKEKYIKLKYEQEEEIKKTKKKIILGILAAIFAFLAHLVKNITLFVLLVWLVLFFGGTSEINELPSLDIIKIIIILLKKKIKKL